MLCTSLSLAPTQLADRLEAEKERAAKRGVALTAWDAAELDVLMKHHPGLVDTGVPTDKEWQEFLGHFQRRKFSTGTCGRAFGTPASTSTPA